jgi:hypothetical protein
MLSGWANSIQGNAYQPPPLVYDLNAVSTGLQMIASSSTDDGFTKAVLGMCEQTRLNAEPRVGNLELLLAQGLKQGKLAPSKTPQERAQMAEILTSFGNVLLSIPSRCQNAGAQLQEASIEEQQAEAQHQANTAAVSSTVSGLAVGAAILGGAMAEASAVRAQANEATAAELQNNMQLQNIDNDLRQQNNILRQNLY